MIASRAGQWGDTEDREVTKDTEDGENIEDHLSNGQVGDRPEEESAEGNTNCDEISTIL